MPLTPPLVDLTPWRISAEAATEVVINMAKRNRRLAEKAGASEAFIRQLDREIHTLSSFIGITEATIEGLLHESRDEFARAMRQLGQWEYLEDWGKRMNAAIDSPDFRTLYPALLAERTEYEARQTIAA